MFSDGTYTPEELIREALSAGLSSVAVVDHDTVDGIEPTIEIARAKDIEVLPGIELTSEYEGLEIHILGYLLDYKNKDLREKLDFLKQNRIQRIYRIVDKLKDIGIKLEAQAVFDIAKEGTVGRLHIARAMVKENLVSSISEAFRKYIGDKCPAYVCGFRFSPNEAISLIKKMAGIPVLAHPYSLHRNELIPVFSDAGLMGLEVYYPEHTKSMVNLYLGLAKKYNLLVTGGSDCHGDAKPEARIGSLKIPYSLVEQLKDAKERI
jgi:predicted metal-dependent phosphoesterase TrpH